MNNKVKLPHAARPAPAAAARQIRQKYETLTVRDARRRGNGTGFVRCPRPRHRQSSQAVGVVDDDTPTTTDLALLLHNTFLKFIENLNTKLALKFFAAPKGVENKTATVEGCPNGFEALHGHPVAIDAVPSRVVVRGAREAQAVADGLDVVPLQHRADGVHSDGTRRREALDCGPPLHPTDVAPFPLDSSDLAH
mmetsp:Transcript_24412/g.71643  ORF Transcript_24412/g.71643 Transcript_24412/m.71643 type:complete len:194 (+) Transcript_24412:86-667(+)